MVPDFIIQKTSSGDKLRYQFSDRYLFNKGCNLIVAVSKYNEKEKVTESISVMGHLDTGAMFTSVDFNVAKKLNLFSIGLSKKQTASGEAITPDYIANLSFPGTKLKSYSMVRIGSVNLGFDFKDKPYSKIGILIGRDIRDIMSKWHITWHGPTSTVFISD